MTDLERLAPPGGPGRALLIGIGNDFAGDDAAGRLIARRLAGTPGFDVIESHGAAADLVAAFEGRRRVVMVDACLSGAAPGTLHRIDAHSRGLPQYLSAVSSHGIGPGQGVALARALGLLPERCDIIAIEAAGFALGTGLSPDVALAVERLIMALAVELA